MSRNNSPTILNGQHTHQRRCSRNNAVAADHANSKPPRKYHTYFKYWLLLGWSAFISLIIVFLLNDCQTGSITRAYHNLSYTPNDGFSKICVFSMIARIFGSLLYDSMIFLQLVNLSRKSSELPLLKIECKYEWPVLDGVRASSARAESAFLRLALDGSPLRS